MAPEQARKEVSNESTDIYNIGSTLFHLLTLRYPLWEKNMEAFWARKRVGDYDHPTREELAHIPGPLLAIAEKCMSSDPQDRYASSQDVAAELRKYQEGLSVDAYRDTFVHLMRRWYRRNTKAFWVGVAGVLACFALVIMYVEERRRSQFQWHDVYKESLDSIGLVELDAQWKFVHWTGWDKETEKELTIGSEEYPVLLEDGKVDFDHDVNLLGGGCLNMIYRGEEPGNVELSWDAKAKGHRLETLSNINCFIAGDDRFNGYTFHVGGYGSNNMITCTRRMRVLEQTFLPEPLYKDVTYNFKVQRVNNHIRLYIDDRLILSVYDVTPLAGKRNQHFGIEIAHIDIEIDNLHVRRQPLPEKVRAIEVANSFFNEGYYEDAYKIYERTDRYLNDKDMKLLSSFGMAAALYEQGKHEQALARLRLLEDLSEDETLRNLSRSQMLRYLIADVSHEKHVENLMSRFELTESFDDSLRRQVLSMYFSFRSSVMHAKDESVPLVAEAIREELNKAAALTQRFGIERLIILDFEHWADQLVEFGYVEEVAANYAALTPFAVAEAFLQMKNYTEVINNYSFITQPHRLAVLRQPDHKLIVRTLAPNFPSVPKSYLALGMDKEIEAIAAKDNEVRGHLLAARKEWSALIDNKAYGILALAKLKRWDDVRKRLNDGKHFVVNHDVYDEMLLQGQCDLILDRAYELDMALYAADILSVENILDPVTLNTVTKRAEKWAERPGVHIRFSFIVDVIHPYLRYRSSGDAAAFRKHVDLITGNHLYTYTDAGEVFEASSQAQAYLAGLGTFMRQKLAGDDKAAMAALERAIELSFGNDDVPVYQQVLIKHLLEIERKQAK